jgi:hypothetical protein
MPDDTAPPKRKRGEWSPERKAKWKARMALTNDRPARGGGDKPAAGNAGDRPPQPFTADDPRQYSERESGGRFTPTARAAMRRAAADERFADWVNRADAARKRIAEAEQELRKWKDAGGKGPRPPGPSHADERLLADLAQNIISRAEGAPTQTIVNPNVLDGLSVADQRAVIEVLDAIARSKGEDQEGDAPKHH